MAGVAGAADIFSFSLGAPSTAAAVSAARPSPSFAGRFVTPDEAKDARSERAVDFASEARALRGDGAAGSHAGTDLLNSRWVSLVYPANVLLKPSVADAAASAAGVLARFAWFKDAFRSFAVSRMASTRSKASPSPSGGLVAETTMVPCSLGRAAPFKFGTETHGATSSA